MCKCKCFAQAKRWPARPGVCRTVKTDFLCLMCSSEKMKYAMHGDDGDYEGRTLECKNCRSYIRYFDLGCETMVKDEFYYDEFCVVRESDKIYVCKNGLDDVILPKFEFKENKHFYEKIKLYLTFL